MFDIIKNVVVLFLHTTNVENLHIFQHTRVLLYLDIPIDGCMENVCNMYRLECN